ncbi:hypothetical protein MDOR_30250 [Mycolicibacterium doricum]|uniref:Uncharacterized protein n=1 Tax=Mycolicibacterium doricum TaxID=126673 RepID=A0A7I7VU88_9MYCO|nr:hypothetical protein [Mycolicibacterium doricum]MCV7267068.1 hypothetical protein [Mycolicibacterium doricum]BBZ08856.1 hypothetical protein MDOR_30250 [Mycolicibacterium doricum]
MCEQPHPAAGSVNKIFGDTLPETSSDERDDRAFGDHAEHERWLRDNVPPHHH